MKQCETRFILEPQDKAILLKQLNCSARKIQKEYGIKTTTLSQILNGKRSTNSKLLTKLSLDIGMPIKLKENISFEELEKYGYEKGRLWWFKMINEKETWAVVVDKKTREVYLWSCIGGRIKNVGKYADDIKELLEKGE